MDKNKLILPVSIIIGCIIIGWFFYSSQVNKQESIERQQRIEMEFKKNEADAKKAQEEAARVKEQGEKNFKNNLECQDMLKALKQKWNNVVGIYYDEFLNTCIVKYTKNGKTLEGALEDMVDSN